MKLRLIGPEEEYEYEWPHLDHPPAVLFSGNPDKVWVKGANSTTDNQLYFEQSGWMPVTKTQLTRVR